MGLRWLCVLALCLGMPSAGFAGEQSGVLRRISCLVRYYVAQYSVSAAEQWARQGQGGAETKPPGVPEARHLRTPRQSRPLAPALGWEWRGEAGSRPHPSEPLRARFQTYRSQIVFR